MITILAYSLEWSNYFGMVELKFYYEPNPFMTHSAHDKVLRQRLGA